MFCSVATFTIRGFAIIGGSSLNWIIISPMNEAVLPPYLKFLTLSVCFAGAIFGYTISTSSSTSSSRLLSAPLINLASCSMWFLTPIASQKVIIIPLLYSLNAVKSLDQG